MTEVGLVNLGCPKNLIDSEIMLGLLPPAHYHVTTNLNEAEVIIANTCAFIEDARRESEKTIRRLAIFKRKKCQVLVVTGCLVQYYGRKARQACPQADLLLGVGKYGKLPEALRRLLTGGRTARLLSESPPRFPLHQNYPRLISTPRHYAYLRIAVGCNNRCHYCLIPRLRGPFQSRPLSLIVSEVRELVAGGVKEIILVAQDTAYYGWAKKKGGLLPRLLEELVAIPDLAWIRVLYTHPAHLDKGILQALASSDKICPYLDVPLQHINNRILKKMGRKITRSRIEDILDQAREMVPGISLRTTLMVGFPGEGKEEFAELLEFVRWQRFDHLGVFTYSREKGTKASRSAPGVNRETAHSRRQKVMAVQRSISASRLKRYRGQRITVLVDGLFPEKDSKLKIGHARFQAPEIDGLVVVEGEGVEIGDLAEVRITGSSSYDLYGVKV